MHNSLPPKTPDALAPARPWQFGLRRLFLLMIGACVIAGIASWLDRELLVIWVLAFLFWTVAVLLVRTITEVIVVGVLILSLIALLLPAFQSPRVTGPRAMCSNNLRQIALALHNYHDVYKSFPPAYVANAGGKPMHSWRVLILPFLEQKPLYDLYRFDEPWDGPTNRQLAAHTLKLFECPANENQLTGQTSYVAVVGPGTAWPGATCVTLSDITDGTDNTLLVVEVHNSGIHWMEPRDLDVSQMPLTINAKSGAAGTNLGISSGHPRVAQAARADGSVFAILEDDTPPATIRAMLTIAGGEKVTPP